jgi:hypothetical protein
METRTAKLSAALVLLAFSTVAIAEPTSRVPVLPLEEQRYCGPPPRLADGSIKRRSDVLAAFRKAHPCPVTGLSTGACVGWAIDHVLPLACGGCDAVSNLQWLPNGLKSVAVIGKDRFERLIYCEPMRTVPHY